MAITITPHSIVSGTGRICASDRLRRLAVLLVAGVMMAACQTGNLTPTPNAPGRSAAPVLSPEPKGEVFGNGNVRIALLLPGTAPGNGAQVATEIRNGALMALQDFGQNIIQMVIKDTVGQAATAQSLAGEAVSEGASLVLGPVFSANVSAASAITRPAGKPMIAFSTDSTVASRGVYLLSFTPQDDVTRMIAYAASQGRRSILMFVPNNAYGSVVEATAREVAGAQGVSIAHIARYERTGPGIEAAVTEAAAHLASADTLYIPEGGAVPSSIMTAIRRLDVPFGDKQLLGSGVWESVKLDDPQLDGAIYPGRDISKFNTFARRYETIYATQPGVNAALGYDAVTLAIELIRRHGANAFSTAVIENNNGYAGINGIFRFRPSGTAQRGLAIYQVVNGQGQLLSPAPVRF